jgi:two-component sensor histidine kinase
MAGGGRTILYIDDDAALVRLVQRALTRHGFVVEGAGTVAEALARLEKGEIDAIALDHFLDGETGMAFLAATAARAFRPPVVYVTASDDVKVAVAALKAGAADYVPKVVGDEFLTLLRRAVEQALKVGELQSERARAEEATREARDLAEALLHEMNHRVANSLSLVAALVRMQAMHAADPAASAALKQVEARIIAIGGVHRLLYASGDARSVDVPSYLARLLEELGRTAGRPGLSITADLPSDRLEIATDKAISLGVIVTELVTNAIKYAYPGAGGEIRVRLRKAADDQATLIVEDDGVGFEGAAEAKGTGFGSRIVATMAKGLGAAIRYGEGSGSHAEVTFAI